MVVGEKSEQEYFEKKSKRIVVEVGSGGFPSFVVGRRKINNDEIYLTVNLNTCASINDAREALWAEQDEKIQGKFYSVVGDATNLPLKSKSVDELIFSNVLNTSAFSGRISEALREANRILKDDGEIIVTSNSENDIRDAEYLEEKGYLDQFGLKIENSHTSSRNDFDDLTTSAKPYNVGLGSNMRQLIIKKVLK